MNKKHLNIILDQYVDNFEMLNRPVEEGGHDEGYKWRVQNAFVRNWNIDAEDFPKMFHDSFSDIAKTNLINNGVVQPIGGISSLLAHDEEVEFVREAFRKLFSDDGGDIEERGDRVETFIDDINEHIEKWNPKSWKYPQSKHAVTYYLTLWKPEDNYIYKPVEARAWANCIEFADDFGTGNNFKLSKYYKMCDELIEALADYPRVLELHEERFKKEAKNFDDELHLLVFDIMHAAYYKGFYRECPSLGVSPKERIRIAKQREEQEKLQNEIDAIMEEINVLEAELQDLPDVTGMKVFSRVYGEGTIKSFDGTYMNTEFENKKVEFNASSVFQGFIEFEDPDIQTAFYSREEQNKKIDGLGGKLRIMLKKTEEQ